MSIKCVSLHINIHILISIAIYLCLINACSVFSLIDLVIFKWACLYIFLYFLLSSFFLKERIVFILRFYWPSLPVHYQACSSLSVKHVLLHWYSPSSTTSQQYYLSNKTISLNIFLSSLNESIKLLWMLNSICLIYTNWITANKQ